MTTNKPEVVAWRWRKPIVNDQGETVGTTAWELGDAPGFLPWWTNDPLIRLSDYEALQTECDALRDKTRLTLGVGDGTGNLFVHGDYDSIKRVQELIFECEKLRADNSELREKQPNPDVSALVEALEAVMEFGCDPKSNRGMWALAKADAALAAHRKVSSNE